MSLASLDTASRDLALQNRTIACVQQEARENPAVQASQYAAAVIANPTEGLAMIWPVALNTEAEYASALANGIPNPGADESVITDGMILAAVQASWPADT